MAGATSKNPTTVNRIEEVLVGIFGAFAGGEFLLSQFAPRAPAAAADFSIVSVGLGIAGAIVMLVLLRVMRGAVGPLRNSKSKNRQ